MRVNRLTYCLQNSLNKKDLCNYINTDVIHTTRSLCNDKETFMFVLINGKGLWIFHRKRCVAMNSLAFMTYTQGNKSACHSQYIKHISQVMNKGVCMWRNSFPSLFMVSGEEWASRQYGRCFISGRCDFWCREYKSFCWFAENKTRQRCQCQEFVHGLGGWGGLQGGFCVILCKA